MRNPSLRHPIPQVIAAIVLLCGFLGVCWLAYRDAKVGYDVRVQNWSGQPIEVYLVQPGEKGTQTTHLFDVWPYQVSGPYVLARHETGELVFAPRGTGRRIARLELAGKAVSAFQGTHRPLLIKLYPTHYYLSDGREWGIRKAPTVPPEAPLLYIGAVGWLITLLQPRKTKRHAAKT